MTNRERQAAIRKELEVVEQFDASFETERRINFLADYLLATGAKGYVLGISGGIDSTVAGRLAQLACERLRSSGRDATFVAMRLPYREQQDESDAADAMQFVAADEEATVNVGPATDAITEATLATGVVSVEQLNHYHRGNIKARQRMIAQFTVAGARGMLVIGTDQAAEALTGFYTKFGDGAADLTPLSGLTKRMVKDIARHLQCPEHLVEKLPTADLESDRPLMADEESLGVSYRDIDAYLEGQDVPEAAEEIILGHYFRSAHKRALPVTPRRFEANK